MIIHWATIVAVAAGVAFPPAAAWSFSLLMRLLGARYDTLTGWQMGCVGGAIGAGTAHAWSLVTGGAISFAIAAFIRWRRRRKGRKRALEALGAKSRALRDALVRKVRESAKPRPVLKPAPGGAR